MTQRFGRNKRRAAREAFRLTKLMVLQAVVSACSPDSAALNPKAPPADGQAT